MGNYMNPSLRKNLEAAQDLLNIHMAKLKSAIAENKYPEVCSALRAIANESENAGRIAAQLSLNDHLDKTPRFSERGKQS